jgi:glycerol kinase
MFDIVKQQVKSTNLILQNTRCKKIFVDGGFSTNEIYMSLLAHFYSTFEVYAASVPQATAIGAALVMHQHWNESDIPASIVKLKRYNS